MKQDIRQRKVCFVTIGATATFDSLINAVLELPFLELLQDNGYTDLRLQYGRDGASILEEHMAKREQNNQKVFGLHITGFDFNKQGLGVEMRAAKQGEDTVEGVVISHAGTQSD